MQALEVMKMSAHSADSREEGGEDDFAAAASAAPDSADDESSQHSKPVEVQIVAAVTAPMDYSEPKCTDAEEEVVAVVAVAASAKAAVAVQIDSDQHFD